MTFGAFQEYAEILAIRTANGKMGTEKFESLINKLVQWQNVLQEMESHLPLDRLLELQRHYQLAHYIDKSYHP